MSRNKIYNLFKGFFSAIKKNWRSATLNKPCISRRLRNSRKLLGLSKKEVANFFEISKQHLCFLEKKMR